MHEFRIVLILVVAGFVTTHAAEGETEYSSTIPKYVNLLFLSTTVLVASLIRIIVLKFNIPIPFAAFAILFGLLWGTIAYHNQFARRVSAVVYMDPDDILYVYTPTLIFYIAFSVDTGIMEKILPQILVIGFPVTLITGVTYGYLMRLIINMDWTTRGGILFGILCSPVYPMAIIDLLKKHPQTKQSSVLLGAEGLFGLIMADIAYTIIVGNQGEFVVYWYQFFSITLRFLLIGILFGYVIGLFGRYLFRTMYTNRLSVFIISFALPFVTYSISNQYFSCRGSVSVAVLGFMMSTERTALSREIDAFLNDFWTMTSFILEIIFTVTCSVHMAMNVASYFSWSSYILVVVSYILYYMVRFVCFLLFSPLTSRLGYGIDLKSLMICVWCGIKCPFSVILTQVFMKYDLQVYRNRERYFYIMGIYILSIFVNGTFTRTLMDFFNLRKISLARQINMNNCIKHIFTKRERTIAILKMDRFLVDTDWPLVITATNVKHPYHIDLSEDEDAFAFRNEYTTCPDCHKDIQQEPSPRELKEMTREANLRVLKAKKMSYSRQFENGMMSGEAIRILTQAVDLAADSEKGIIELEGLVKRFTTQGPFTKRIRSRVQDLNKNKKASVRQPRKYLRRVCHNIVVNKTWEKAMCYVIMCDVIMLAVGLIYVEGFLRGQWQTETDLLRLVIGFFFTAIYILEFVMKILAYSWVYIWRHGIRTYFKSFWNILDFIVIIVYIIHLWYSLQVIQIVSLSPQQEQIRFIISLALWLRAIRLLRLFEIFYPALIKYLDSHFDSKVAFTYELGKSYTIGETEVLDLLPYMIDNKNIRDGIKKKIEADRVVITKLLGIVQKEKPWVAITVKTKQAIRTILKSMVEANNQLKISGWVDDYEQEKLEIEMTHLYKKVNALQTVQPSAPKVIFREVTWMTGEEDVIDFLFENVTVKTFEPGDVAFGEGTVADGIYIVVTGLFLIKYVPQKSTIDSLHEYGILPIVDYLSSTKYEEASLDYIVSGNCIGELSTLTRRSYNCTITADTHSQVYVLSYNVLTRAMELSPDLVAGLECRIWKEVSIRIAVPLLLSVPTYQNYSQDEIKYTLERAFVPNLADYKIFTVTEMIQDIILIEGVVADFNTRDFFVAPCCIPRRVQKLILPTSSLMNIPIYLETKLLIVPEKDLDEYDVMATAEETGEMVAMGSATKCLHHMIQERAKQRKRMKLMQTPAKKTTQQKKSGFEEMPAEETSTLHSTSTLPESSITQMFGKDKKNTSSDRRSSETKL